MEILSLGEKIKRKRKALNMTLKDLAKDRITPGQISLVESGRSNPSMDLLEYLSNSLNTSVEYLMESEESQAEKICKYYSEVAESYIISEDFDTAEEYIKKSLEYVEKYHLDYRQGKIFFLEGKLYAAEGEFTLAQQKFLSANVIFTRNNNFEDIVETFLNLGIITLNLKAYHSANSYLRQAEKVYIDNNIGDDHIIGEIYYYMAKTFYGVENLEKAREYTYLARDKFDFINDKKSYAKSLLEISNEYSQKADLVNALRYSEKTLEVYEEINHMKKVVSIENDLGKLFYGFENINESFRRYDMAKRAIDENDKKEMVRTMFNICDNHIKLKDIKECEHQLEEVYKYLDEDDVEGRIQYNLFKYRLCIIKERYSDAENILVETYNYATEKNMSKSAGELAIKLGKYFMDKKEVEKATKYLDEGVEIFRKLEIIEN